MKRVTLYVGAIVLLSTHLFAGKNVAPAIEPPVPVPVEPVKPQTTPPLGFYLGGGFTYAYDKCKCAPIVTQDGPITPTSKSHTYGFHLRGGYEYNPFIGIEARYMYTPWGDKDRSMKHFGIYFKPTYAIAENVDLYGLLGYGKTKCEYQNINENGFAWGLGAEYTFGQREEGMKKGWGIYAEYTRPIKKSGSKNITTNVGNIGIAYHY